MEKAKDVKAEIKAIIKEIVKNHKRIIFNGNNYSDEWVKEAEKRGLPNIKSTVAAIPYLISDKAVKVFEKHQVLSKVELHSRYEIYLENYIKQINIEALTMLDMAKRQILPATIKFSAKIADAILKVKSASANANIAAQEDLLLAVTNGLNSMSANIATLESLLEGAGKITIPLN